MKFVIIGNSAAGISAVEGIRQADSRSSITVISKDSQAAYSPALTTYLISEKIKEKNIFLKEEEFYQKNKVDLLLGKEAVSIDPQKKTVKIKGGSKVSYDKLLIAVGAKPVVPPIQGIDCEGVFTLRNLDDAKKISKYASRRGDVLVIGGGLVGLRAAYAMEQLGKRVTVVELADQIMPQNLDKKAAGIVRGFLEEKGWKIITGKSVKSLNPGEKGVSSATLSDGGQIDAQMVIVGTGVRPDTGLAQSAGIKTNQGIIADSKMQVTVKGINNPGIFTAGDVCEAYDKLLKKKAVNAIWPLAREQGFVAGLNMAGCKKPYGGGFPMNSVDFYGLTAMSAGRNELPSTVFKVKAGDKQYRKIGIKDNKLVYYILIGNVDRAGILTELIRDGIDVSTFKKSLMDDNFGFLDMPQEIRTEKILSKAVV